MAKQPKPLKKFQVVFPDGSGHVVEAHHLEYTYGCLMVCADQSDDTTTVYGPGFWKFVSEVVEAPPEVTHG